MYFLFSSLFLASIGVIAALGDKTQMISAGYASGRYFYIPVICLALACSVNIQARRLTPLWLIVACWFLMIFSAFLLVIAVYIRRIDRRLAGLAYSLCIVLFLRSIPVPATGPAWSDALAEAGCTKETVEIWPRDWQMPNPREC